MHRVVQTGKPGLVAMRVTQGLRMLISQIAETTVAVLAIVQHNDFDRVVSAAVEAARLGLPEDELQAAAGVIERAGDQPAEILQRQLRDAAPTVVQYAQRSLGESVNWNAAGAVGTWVAVVIAVITLIFMLGDQDVDQNIYINIEQVFHIEDQ